MGTDRKNFALERIGDGCGVVLAAQQHQLAHDVLGRLGLPGATFSANNAALALVAFGFNHVRVRSVSDRVHMRGI